MTQTTVPKRGPGRPRKNPAAPAFQEPLIAQAPSQVRMVEGVAVVREEVIQHLPNAPFRISRLHLADDTTVFACRDCHFTGPTRGSVIAHRNEEHGGRVGKNRAKVELPPLKEAPDPVLKPRKDGKPAPSNPMEMTLAEILSLAPSLAALGDLVERVENERDDALAELATYTKREREFQNRIDTWEDMRDELVTLRLLAHQQRNYDDIKAEMYALRGWKRKMTQKLSALGFQLNEEDQ